MDQEACSIKVNEGYYERKQEYRLSRHSETTFDDQTPFEFAESLCLVRLGVETFQFGLKVLVCQRYACIYQGAHLELFE